MSCICTKCSETIKPFQKVLVEVDSHEFGKEGDSRKVWVLGTNTGMSWLILCDFGTGKSKSVCRIQAPSMHPNATTDDGEYVRGFRVICKKCRTLDGWGSKLEHKTYELGLRGNRLNPKYMVHMDGKFEEAPSCLSDTESDDDGSVTADSGSDDGSDTESEGSEDIDDIDEESTRGSKISKISKSSSKAKVSVAASVAPMSPAKSTGKRSLGSVISMESQDVGAMAYGGDCPYGSPDRKCRKMECPGAPARKPTAGPLVTERDLGKDVASLRKRLQAILDELDA